MQHKTEIMWYEISIRMIRIQYFLLTNQVNILNRRVFYYQVTPRYQHVSLLSERSKFKLYSPKNY